eukprot:CAMPEP_0119431428 /NCGR_PEP_ID=MMETSP1335-20130426/45895_1 /TAXON_ID=259385 /ORGANISM="Chrysoculter rhomboideus, Strain RCC1486" /LENGTH=44 /DNA_ID= /DNA_START= /DNA_END= /DNA_ORIENTATION=
MVCLPALLNLLAVRAVIGAIALSSVMLAVFSALARVTVLPLGLV